MRFALVNPRWNFSDSIYFGCRQPHLPLEFGYAKHLLEAAGHESIIIDCHFFNFSPEDVRISLTAFSPDFTVISTAPTYLFWRCCQPELRDPKILIRTIKKAAGTTIAVGPHASVTPAAAVEKLGADLAIIGEFEDVLPNLKNGLEHPSLFHSSKPRLRDLVHHTTDLGDLPPLRWPIHWIARHQHQHHRFDRKPEGPGAEIEASRGCPFSCHFCAKLKFRNKYRVRRTCEVLAEIDGLLESGVEYFYFIDEIFLPRRDLLNALKERNLKFGIQTRIDLWQPDSIELLGNSGCVSIEAGVESITETGRRSLGKKCRIGNHELIKRLILAKRFVPFVQANLIKTGNDDGAEIARWRECLFQAGVWANDPVPLFPYPGSNAYEFMWGIPDDNAWERAHSHYLAHHSVFGEIQESKPLSISELEMVEY